MEDVWQTLQPYIKTVDILQCPTAPDSADFSGCITTLPGGDYPLSSTSYAISGRQLTVDDWAHADAIVGYWTARIINNRSSTCCQYSSPTYFNLDFFGQPHVGNGCVGQWQAASTFLLFDATLEAQDGSVPDPLTDITQLAIGYNGAPWRKNSCSYNIWADPYKSTGTVQLVPDARHNGRVNFAFMDGHAKSLSKAASESTGTLCGWDWSARPTP